jgi:hypothetical protein
MLSGEKFHGAAGDAPDHVGDFRRPPQGKQL